MNNEEINAGLVERLITTLEELQIERRQLAAREEEVAMLRREYRLLEASHDGLAIDQLDRERYIEDLLADLREARESPTVAAAEAGILAALFDSPEVTDNTTEQQTAGHHAERLSEIWRCLWRANQLLNSIQPDTQDQRELAGLVAVLAHQVERGGRAT